MTTTTNTLKTVAITDVELTYARVGAPQQAPWGDRYWNVMVTATPGTQAFAVLEKFKAAGGAVEQDGDNLTANIKQKAVGNAYIRVFDANGIEMDTVARNSVGHGSRGDVAFAWGVSAANRLFFVLREVKVTENKVFTPQSILGAPAGATDEEMAAREALLDL